MFDLIKEYVKSGESLQLPFFTTNGWLVIFLVSALSGIVGALLYSLMMSPFTAN